MKRLVWGLCLLLLATGHARAQEVSRSRTTLSMLQVSNARGSVTFGGVGTSANPYGRFVATLPEIDGGKIGFVFSVTRPSVTAMGANTGVQINLNDGATFISTQNTAGLRVNNHSQSTGNGIFTGNVAVEGFTDGGSGSSDGINVGVRGWAKDSTVSTIGVEGVNSGSSPLAFGVIGLTDAGTASVPVGGYFGFVASDTSPYPTVTSGAALIADNGTSAADIFVARDNGTPVFTISAGRAITLVKGTGTAVAVPSGVLTVNTTSQGTGADTSEDTLWSYTLPANTLSADGQGVRISFLVTSASNTNNKTLKLYFGSHVVISDSTTTSGASWSALNVVIVRKTSSAQEGFAVVARNGSVLTTGEVITSESTSNDIVIKITGTNGTASANDIVFRLASVEALN